MGVRVRVADCGLAARQRCLDAVDERVQAGSKPFVAIIGPYMLAEDGQRGEAVRGQRAQEGVQVPPGRGVLDALHAGAGAVGEREAEGVVVDQPVGEGGLGAGHPGRVERAEECLGQGEGVRAERVAGLQQPGDARVVFQHYPQPLGERGDLPGPGEGGIGPAVHLGQHAIEDEVVQKVHRAERTYGAFRHSITLPSHVEAGKIEAAAQDGVLQVVVPKACDVKAKRIEVRAGQVQSALKPGTVTGNGN